MSQCHLVNVEVNQIGGTGNGVLLRICAQAAQAPINAQTRGRLRFNHVPRECDAGFTPELIVSSHVPGNIATDQRYTRYACCDRTMSDG